MAEGDDLVYYEEIEKLIDILEPHKEEFLQLKKEYPEFSFWLEAVIYLGDSTPGLHFENRVIKFVNDLGGEIDCDIYNSK